MSGQRAHERVRFRLHHKKRRLSLLRDRLRRAQQDQGPPSLCFGSRKLFCAQFHLTENGFASYAGWLRVWREARSNAFFCLGSKDEAGGNQTCTLLSSGTLRLRVPHALVGRYGTHVVIPGIRGADDFPAGRCCGRGSEPGPGDGG